VKHNIKVWINKQRDRRV